MLAFSKTLIFFKASIRWVGMWMAFRTTLLAPQPIAPNTHISLDAQLYDFSGSPASPAASRVVDLRFCNPSSLMLYSAHDLLSRFNEPPSVTFITPESPWLDNWPQNSLRQSQQNAENHKIKHVNNLNEIFFFLSRPPNSQCQASQITDKCAACTSTLNPSPKTIRRSLSS